MIRAVAAVLLGLATPLAAQPPAAPAAEALLCPLDRPYDSTNPFARIMRGELPASRVYEDRRVMVIMPLEWNHPGHALVIPKRAVRSLDDMTPAELTHALVIVRRVAAAQRLALSATGYTVAVSNARSQHICHVHFHVVPNTPLAPQDPVSRVELDRMAERLKVAFEAR